MQSMENYRGREEIVYQVYPKSFCDSDGDDIGDLKGITEKLGYLKDLGITMLWICPVYASPMDDNGYDISDYYSMNPMFGTMDEMEQLIHEAGRKGIKIMMDLVLNHTSDEHEWFRKALADPQSKYRDYYIFETLQNGCPPSNLRSVFGGSVWEPVPGTDEYYFHSFSKKQPDLNWENKEMRSELYEMIRWWMNKGIAGFRVDAINFIKKDLNASVIKPDGKDGLASCFPYTRNVEGIQKFLKEMRKEVFEPCGCITVSEAVDVPYSELGNYIGDQGCFSMMFDFHYTNFDLEGNDEKWHKRKDWTMEEFRELLFESQEEIQKTGWQGLFIENHDQPRAVNKFFPFKEDQTYEASTVLAGMYFFLRGTPFIYQGQELGVKNVWRDSIESFDDIESRGQYETALSDGCTKEEALYYINLRSRDNARQMIDWEEAGRQENDKKSVLSFYKEMTALRKRESCLVQGSFKPHREYGKDVVAYERNDGFTRILVLCNFSKIRQEIKNVDGKILLSNQPVIQGFLEPFQVIVIKK
ncbi:Family 13 glycosyl hydrolase [Anaerostipes rhamnosivorans]|uniref:Family 13 glycosyl hydrolase n=2 Tax=Anaerostipes rhamnosivorans TaxID=1229621 RepID=A0A4P8IC56_9FIRM|nr:Family 13 glycosyl hydrolase [Anaerostipes rhamnosivorans]